MASEWTVDTLKQHLEALRNADQQAYDQRFQAQETAISKAEANRDTAINKAELSIEKKSDAVYVKLTDLQKAFSEVMLRPEIEGRLSTQAKEITALSKTIEGSVAKGAGARDLWTLIAAGILLAIGIANFLNK